MKIVVGLILSITLYADTLFVLDAKGNESQKKFLKVDAESCYYQNSYKHGSNCYKQTGNIFIKSDEPLSKEFLQRYNLKYLKQINRQNSTSLYGVLNSSIDIIDIVNKINKENNALIVRVEWIKPRRLF